MFENLNIPKNVAQEKESVGGKSFIVETGVYKGIIEVAYGSTAKSGAKAVNLHVRLVDGTVLRETVYVTNKQGGVTYTNKKDNTEHFLPGYSQINGLVELVTGKGLASATMEDKVINLWNFDHKKEMPTTVPVLVDLTNKPIEVAVLKELVNKKEQVGNEWVATAETKEINTIDRFFDVETGKTIGETREGSEAVFKDKWLKNWEGKTKDSTDKTIKPATRVGSSAKTSSLFDDL